MSWPMGIWMEKMSYISAEPSRPAIIVVLAQANGAAIDEASLASSAGIMHQQISGQVVETARMITHVHELAENGFIERDETGFRWKLTPLGVLISRQWVPDNVEPAGFEPLSLEEVRGWRDRVLAVLEYDAELAEQSGIAREELLVMQSGRLSELHVLNRVLGDEAMPGWFIEMRDRVENEEELEPNDAE